MISRRINSSCFSQNFLLTYSVECGNISIVTKLNTKEEEKHGRIEWQNGGHGCGSEYDG